ncbi:hypothetical protein BDW22DRAFT_1481995 [Trametopsis cervina]|nr:hypothetical protein BDW22DRAFT_1481995 [Trametopsis cervina]
MTSSLVDNSPRYTTRGTSFVPSLEVLSVAIRYGFAAGVVASAVSGLGFGFGSTFTLVEDLHTSLLSSLCSVGARMYDTLSHTLRVSLLSLADIDHFTPARLSVDFINIFVKSSRAAGSPTLARPYIQQCLICIGTIAALTYAMYYASSLDILEVVEGQEPLNAEDTEDTVTDGDEDASLADDKDDRFVYVWQEPEHALDPWYPYDFIDYDKEEQDSLYDDDPLDDDYSLDEDGCLLCDGYYPLDEDDDDDYDDYDFNNDTPVHFWEAPGFYHSYWYHETPSEDDEETLVGDDEEEESEEAVLYRRLDEFASEMLAALRDADEAVDHGFAEESLEDIYKEFNGFFDLFNDFLGNNREGNIEDSDDNDDNDNDHNDEAGPSSRIASNHPSSATTVPSEEGLNAPSDIQVDDGAEGSSTNDEVEM